MENGNNIENLILSTLQENPFLTIIEIAERVNVNRLTASKYLHGLERSGFVKYRTVGNAKLFYLARMVKA